MRVQSLNGSWEFCAQDSNEWLPGTVPGGVHTDLQALHRIPDPFIGDNEKKVQWVAEKDWTYKKQFTCSLELLAEEKIFLVCDGLDTLAQISLNGQVLGTTDNMFRRYEWEVKPILKPDGVNELVVIFSSAVRFIKQKQADQPLPGVPQAIPGGPYLRKAPCQFGWDWGPQLPPIGIWKDIRLEGYTQARLSDINIRQEHKNGEVTLQLHLSVENWNDEKINARVQVTTPRSEILTHETPVNLYSETIINIPIHNPQLWWPNGYGNQPLYSVNIELVSGDENKGNVMDKRSYQIGLRTIELCQKEDDWGRSFAFRVNDVQILAKGANWIPADSFPTRITESSLDMLIRSARDSHQNMLRVWGGGIYEDERFYDLCDHYGILVWQEFIFSCSGYPLYDASFLENVHQEVRENIHRLRHRACLAVWCGNNEMEEGWVYWGWNQPELQYLKSAYDQFFHHLLKEWCVKEDPDRTYWPSSPSSDTPFIDPNGQSQGDCHYWEVWHRGQPFTAYRNQYPRFMSEFGFQALPPLRTIQTYADEREWNMTSYIMEQHQKNANGNSFIVRQMLDTFRLPKDFSSLVYLSMVLQAEGIRYGVEHWRRHPDRVAGILYWQLNDCWPVASWSSLDYFGRWKALHYAARNFYAPLLLSIEDQPPVQTVFLSNDTLDSWEGKLNWSLETFDGTVVQSGEIEVQVGPQCAKRLLSVDFTGILTDENRRKLVFIAELRHDREIIAVQTAFFAPIKHLQLEKPAIKSNLKVDGDQIIIDLYSQSLAVLVEVSFSNTEGVFSDNYFNLPAGKYKQISFPSPAGWTLNNAEKEIMVRSIYDSY